MTIATTGRRCPDAVTSPRNTLARRSRPKLGTVALQSMATAHRSTEIPRARVRRTRSATTPNGMLATAATNEVTATSRPKSVFPIPRALRSSVAEAPTVAVSAPLRASTHAKMTITRVRSGPPRVRSNRPPVQWPARNSVRFALPAVAWRNVAVPFPCGGSAVVPSMRVRRSRDRGVVAGRFRHP
jgi:hypothetical protein